eukprot:TRINITY_DN593_c0_g1_i1.p1 TRINITY_DN593_c0_g1~~TRINITY_DN593_c0_g1_i1.p1  ORF type:complete len:199 (+),score=5.07 TRINITY_DN593_c0_g1_i1:236-832(+)
MFLPEGGNSNDLSKDTFVEQTSSLTTLDEPIKETLLRDARLVGRKIKTVLIPQSGNSASELRNWDLWGPLFICLFLAIVSSYKTTNDQSALVFASIFVIVWCGAAVVTANALLLGGTISFFQSVCALGYCIFPLAVASVLVLFWSNIIYRIIVVSISFGWATMASIGFMGDLVPANRRILAVYPVFLFYISVSWMILT